MSYILAGKHLTLTCTNLNLEKCDIVYKRCPVCLSFHSYSFVVDEEKKLKYFYPDSLENEYFHFSSETYFETKLIHSLMADIFFKHCSFKAYANACNYQFMAKEFERIKLDHRRLIDFFYCYHLVKYFKEFLKQSLVCN